jgi:hypothetical protein
MITREALEEINKELDSIPVKGKAYVMVNERVKAFRKLMPNGTITTDILSNDNGVVTMKTTISDEEGRVLATGLSYEKEGNGNINRTSYIENCETSAVGRALGFLGIGIDKSMASADEVANAIIQQGEAEMKEQAESTPASEAEMTTIKSLCKKKGKSFSGWLKNLKKEEADVNGLEAGQMLRYLNGLPDKEEK